MHLSYCRRCLTEPRVDRNSWNTSPVTWVNAILTVHRILLSIDNEEVHPVASTSVLCSSGLYSTSDEITSGRTCVLSLASNQWGGNWLLATSQGWRTNVSVTVADKTADKSNWTIREGVMRSKRIRTHNFFSFRSLFFGHQNSAFFYPYLLALSPGLIFRVRRQTDTRK